MITAVPKVFLKNDALTELKNDLLLSTAFDKIYKNSFRRHGKRLKVVPVVEGGWSSNSRFHIHLVMEYPDTKIISNSDFNFLLLRCWYKTFYRYDHPHIHTKTDLGWVGYMTKFYEKDDFVDWVNVTI